MTKEQLAEKLNGRHYACEITPNEAIEAKASGLVVIFGYSDDNIELEGAIRDEIGLYGGGELKIHSTGVLQGHQRHCECDFCGYQEKASKCATIKAIWGDSIDKQYAWRFETKIPHATFEIFEDGELWAQGIVISVDDLPKL